MMDNWETAKNKFDQMTFSDGEFINRVRESQNGKAVLDNGAVMSDPHWYGVDKYPATHKINGEKHEAVKTIIGKLGRIGEFYFDGYQKYCKECGAVFEETAVLFNNKDREAYIRKFGMTEKPWHLSKNLSGGLLN